MKCLSLWQPWATLIAIGAKRIETRSWETPYRGPLLIHAAKRHDGDSLSLIADEPFRRALINERRSLICDLPFGAIIAIAHLDRILTIGGGHKGAVILVESGESVSSPEREFGNYELGRFAWMLTNIRRFQHPIPFIGHQRIFDVPDHIVADAIKSAIQIPDPAPVTKPTEAI